MLDMRIIVTVTAEQAEVLFNETLDRTDDITPKKEASLRRNWNDQQSRHFIRQAIERRLPA